MRCTELTLMPAASAILAPVQCVASRGGGSFSVSATTRSTTARSSDGVPGGRVLSRSSPSTPSSAKRSCQRQTQVFDLAVARMMPLVPMPSAVRRTIRARQTCFCGLLRSPTIASRRRRSPGETSMVMPVRMPQTRTAVR